MQHIEKEHPYYKEAARQGKSLVISDKAKKLYAWIQWVVMENRTLEFQEMEILVSFQETKDDEVVEATK